MFSKKFLTETRNEKILYGNNTYSPEDLKNFHIQIKTHTHTKSKVNLFKKNVNSLLTFFPVLGSQ